ERTKFVRMAYGAALKNTKLHLDSTSKSLMEQKPQWLAEILKCRKLVSSLDPTLYVIDMLIEWEHGHSRASSTADEQNATDTNRTAEPRKILLRRLMKGLRKGILKSSASSLLSFAQSLERNIEYLEKEVDRINRGCAVGFQK